MEIPNAAIPKAVPNINGVFNQGKASGNNKANKVKMMTTILGLLITPSAPAQLRTVPADGTTALTP